MSNVPVMPLGGGGDVFAELFKFWDDAVAPTKCEELKARLHYDSSGCQRGFEVDFDQADYPEHKDMYLFLLAGEHYIDSIGNKRTGMWVQILKLYWYSLSGGGGFYSVRREKDGIGLETSGSTSFSLVQQGGAGSSDSDQKKLILYYNLHSAIDETAAMRYEVPIAHVFLIRHD